jgi:hypothetical protein
VTWENVGTHSGSLWFHDKDGVTASGWAFGLGNLLSAQSAACCPAATQDGVLLQVTVVRKAGRFVVGAVRYTPTWVEHSSGSVALAVRWSGR